jgi:hypothetical protein
VYKESSKHSEFSFIPEFAKSAEKMRLLYQNLYAIYNRPPI